MQLVKTGEQMVQGVFGWLEGLGVKPKFWSHVMEIWGVKGRDYGEYIAPRATSAEAWIQMKYDEKIPLDVKITLAKIEVSMVARFQQLDKARALIEQQGFDARDLHAFLMAFMCFPPRSDRHGFLEMPVNLARSAGLKAKRGCSTANAGLLDMID